MAEGLSFFWPFQKKDLFTPCFHWGLLVIHKQDDRVIYAQCMCVCTQGYTPMFSFHVD